MSEPFKKRKRSELRKGRFENDKLDQSLPFYFDIPLSCRILVDSSHTLDLLDSVISDAIILGIDTETRPSVYNYSSRIKNKTALLQVCTRSNRGNEMVFILDMIRLAALRLLHVLDKILAPPLADDNVIKVGHGLAYDLKELQASYPEMSAFNLVDNILDTTKMYKKLRPDEKNNISLKKLTKIYLHLNLIKSQTCSDWEMRPLSESQLHYCACDALVLLRLYDAMTFDALDVFGETNFFEDVNFSVCCVSHNKTDRSDDKMASDIKTSQCITLGNVSDSVSNGSVDDSDDDDTDSVMYVKVD